MQHDAGAALLARDRLDRELAIGARFPAHCLLRSSPGTAAEYLHALGDHEAGIKSHPELPDQRRILLLIAGEALEELGSTRLGDGSELCDRLLAAHADAVVAHGQGSALGIGIDPDRERAVLAEQRWIRERQETQLVVGVGGVGNQLAQEYFPVAIQGMDHQLQ